MDQIILLLRLIVPLWILHSPLIGGLAAFWLDGADWHVNFFNVPNIHEHYQGLDKALDIYYLSLEVFVAWHWRQITPRRIALSLYFYRLVGVILYQLTQLRLLLFIFPNIFESFFLFYLGCQVLLGKNPRVSGNLN